MEELWSDALCHRLESGLRQWRPFWAEVPFYHPRPAWSGEHPGLSETLLALTDDEAERLGQDPDGLASSVPGLQEVRDWRTSLVVPSLAGELPQPPPFFDRDIPGRKWDQIRHFVAALPAEGSMLVDWCSGKGHLGRLASWHRGLPTQGLERDAALCRDGQALAQRWHLPMTLHECDVLGPAVPPLSADATVIALHACGDLHRRLLELSVAQQVSAVALSPCCYHLQAGDTYRPMSTGTTLGLSRDDLRLAVQETVTAPQRVRRLRAQEQAYRLGFDALQRELRGQDAFLPLPSLPYALLAGDFATFCREVAALKSLALPPGFRPDHWLAEGQRRLQEVRRFELVRHVFRRPLELWLVADRVRFLRQAGYHVEAGEFCPRALTPRNLMIRARRDP